MINLFDNYGLQSKDLHKALIASGIDNRTIVLNETGFLPESVESPYMFFVKEVMKKDEKWDDQTINPLYFNEVPIPKFWEIKGDGNKAEVYEYHRLKATIRYALPNHLRLVNKVEWLDDAKRIRKIDHYNHYGWRYAQAVYDETNNIITTSYYTKQAKEVIVENHITQDIIVSLDNKIHVFKNKKEFILFYLEQRSYNLDSIIYNSLGLPLMISHDISIEGSDTLVWQEEISGEIPGNMKFILDKHTKRTKRIVVQTKENYTKIGNEYSEAIDNSLFYVGNYYEYRLLPKNKKKAFILTNSDNIENIELIIESTPEIEFNIAALTTMSDKLKKLDKFPNVKLFANAKLEVIKSLLESSGFYLDINHGNEVLDVIRSVFEHQKLILSFDQTIHSKDFVASELCFDSSDASTFIETLKTLSSNDETYDKFLSLQLQQADVGTVEEYKKLFDC